MIRTDNLSLSVAGKRLLNRITLHCAPGTLTALVGPNGAGKSTLLSVMAGDTPPSDGTITLAGKAPQHYSLRALAQQRAVFPQNTRVHFGFRVAEVVAMGRAMRDLPPHTDADAINQAMQRAEISHLARQDIQTLSGGELARTTFARVLAQQTPVILLDEPTAALDLRHQERLLATLKDLASQGTTILVVLHDLNVAAAYADTIAILQDGRLIAAGPPQDVLTRERIATVYQQDVCVITHPERHCPVILPY
ncbi:heme ABC transporter ATP-binding protein [Shimwellia pseudoproteus]|uniref:heme ABC transporter ATP-binding protein n=1 Tax=Shimwellia pseudoproteus TaxID=570012 RepID=UPI0018EB581C|nr:heme ABC transporter ATP-binding protein [Shimwellia pseudoproteus]MBJ3816874.1 heme ABC transporter ATP-binding protein [Shimwellia pseudoproteus]